MSFVSRYGFVYMLTNKNNTVLYTGVTNDLLRRLEEHKKSYNIASFTAKYKVNKLVYFEKFATLPLAIFREKQIKNLVRRKKIALIETNNQSWSDLSGKL